MRTTLKEKAPELLVEALSVVFAVLAALAVDEWREDRQNAELASRALDAIVAEVEQNQAELDGARPANLALLERLAEAARDTVLPDELDLEFDYSLVSSSAWETAQVTRATHFMELYDVQRLARLYDLQGLYEAAQDQVLDFILNVGDIAEETPERIPRLARARIATAMGIEEILVQAYDSVLSEVDVRRGGGPAR